MEQKWNRRKTGAKYEQVAAEYLREHGFQILQKNYRNPCGEIDIVAKKDAVIVFCEVKYRSGTRSGDPLEAIDRKKMRRISRAALYYCAEGRKDTEQEYRFDVIGIYGDGRIRHIENAFDFQM